MHHRVFCAVLALLSACDGSVLGGLLGNGQPSPFRPGGPTNPGTTDPTEEPLSPERPGPSSRILRLNHLEYENTVTDLLRLPARPNVASTFVTDSTGTLFDTNGSKLNVDSTVWTDYQRGAEQLAATATADMTALTRLFGGTVPSGAEAQVRLLGQRAFRRPLNDDEVAALVTLYGRAATLTPAVAPGLGGPRLVLEVLLQSPHFLYRPELSDQVGANGLVALSGYEIANRLSYALWHTMPDEQLFAAAESGALSTLEGLATQVRRLLVDARAKETVTSFHDQLLQIQKVFDITRSTNLFPEFVPALRQSMATEQRLFIQHVIFERQQGLKELYTAPFTFADANLARVYRLNDVTGSAHQRVEFTDGRRAGLFTHVAFLATNATSIETDPIHRGTTINFRILCTGLPPPPNMVPPLPADDPNMPRTMRQRIEAFTGRGTCGDGCHSTFINPVGFAFEHYDALGRWRDTEKGMPVDDSGAFRFDFDGELKPFSSGVEFTNRLAASQMTHACYVRNWGEYLYGRALSESEMSVTRRLGRLSQREDVAVLRVIEELLVSDVFRFRPAEVQP